MKKKAALIKNLTPMKKKMSMKRFEGTPMDIAVDKAAIKKMNAMKKGKK